MGRRATGALVATLCGFALSACGGGDPGEFTGHVVDPPFAVPTAPLTDTSGHDFSLTADTDRRLTLVFFGYTHCPDICGVVMQSLTSAMTRLSADDRDQVDVVYVTTDPARDTEKVLRNYLDHLDPAFIGLTGDLKDIVATGRPLGVGITQGERLASGGYDVTHGTTITGVDGDDEAPVYWNEDTSSAEFAADIHSLLAKGS
ncbi:SCO family protein [Nocardioides sp.]|uniref:SCO family protein n=1 Tax=Nocardioides sp. TaxID=35761 RepID=UPI0031FE5D30|nr:SCO1/SenC [Nocardioides sp.]